MSMRAVLSRPAFPGLPRLEAGALVGAVCRQAPPLTGAPPPPAESMETGERLGSRMSPAAPITGVPEEGTMTQSTMTSRNASRLFAGLVILALGVLALLGNFGIVQIPDVWRFWPLILVALGLARLLRPRGSRGRCAGVVLLFIGLWLLLENLDVWPYGLESLWPVFVVLLGAYLIWGGLRRFPPAAMESDEASRVNSFAILGGTEHHSSAPDFQGGDATAILGGCKVDLRQAVIKGGEATMDVFAFWGGVEILIPRSWGVVLRGSPILGGFEDKTEPPREGGGPRLIVRGAAIMGGVEIKN
jgi:predicted membrane protein